MEKKIHKLIEVPQLLEECECLENIINLFEPQHDKTNKMTCASAQSEENLGP